MTEKSNERIEKEVKSAAELASKMAELMVQETQS